MKEARWWEYGDIEVLAIMNLRPGDRSFRNVLDQRIPRIKASYVIATSNVGFVLVLVAQSTLPSVRIVCGPFSSWDRVCFAAGKL